MVGTNIYFVRSRIYEAIDAIKSYSKQSNVIDSKEVHWDEGGIDDDEIFVDIPLYTDINTKLDRIFSVKYGKAEWHEDDLHFAWDRLEDNKRFWKLGYWGRPLCKDYLRLLEGSKSYDECTCPQEFAKVCHDLINILRKFSIRKQ